MSTVNPILDAHRKRTAVLADEVAKFPSVATMLRARENDSRLGAAHTEAESARGTTRATLAEAKRNPRRRRADVADLVVGPASSGSAATLTEPTIDDLEAAVKAADAKAQRLADAIAEQERVLPALKNAANRAAADVLRKRYRTAVHAMVDAMSALDAAGLEVTAFADALDNLGLSLPGMVHPPARFGPMAVGDGIFDKIGETRAAADAAMTYS